MEEFEVLIDSSLGKLETARRDARLREIDRLIAAIDELEASLSEMLKDAPPRLEFHPPGAEKVRS